MTLKVFLDGKCVFILLPSSLGKTLVNGSLMVHPIIQLLLFQKAPHSSKMGVWCSPAVCANVHTVKKNYSQPGETFTKAEVDKARDYIVTIYINNALWL